jgi:macrodomain Ter protein organizer (MatP/YcbG family)
MPFKSKAQRRKFAELLVKGEISPETFEEWNRETGRAKLPERVHPKVRAKPKRKTKAKRAPKSKRRQPKARAQASRRRAKT